MYKMSDTIDCNSLSNKMKMFLTRKLEERQAVIRKLKRKRTIIKTLSYSTTVISIVISAVLAATATAVVIPPIAIIVLSTASGILTAISSRFNFQAKSNKLNTEIENLNKLISKFDFVVSCNGNLTQETYNQIISEFN
jgi:hypothetical protein